MFSPQSRSEKGKGNFFPNNTKKSSQSPAGFAPFAFFAAKCPLSFVLFVAFVVKIALRLAVLILRTRSMNSRSLIRGLFRRRAILSQSGEPFEGRHDRGQIFLAPSSCGGGRGQLLRDAGQRQ